MTIAWNAALGKTIAIQASETPRYFLKGRVANKWIDPTVEPQLLEWEGLRGFRTFEVNGPTPRDWTLLAEVSTDPNHGPHEIQEGNGALDLPVYYGGRYLFVGSAPDNTFTNQPYKTTLWAAGHVAFDVSDPANPVRLSDWWVPGSRVGEEADSPYLAGNERWNNHTSWFGSRMGLFMPRSQESGWRYGYAAQGGQGFFVVDISDPANMHHVGWCELPPSVAGTEGDNVDTTQVEATGYVYVSGYPMNTDCYEPAKEIYQIDVRDPQHPVLVRTLPRPMPPAEAPFTDYAQRRGSFGPKRSGYFINTGTPHGGIIPYAFYSGGLQIFDVSDPEKPTVGAYFVPPMGLKDDDDLAAPVHGIFVEWDRNIIWLFANHGIYAVSTSYLGEVKTGPARLTRSAWRDGERHLGNGRFDDQDGGAIVVVWRLDEAPDADADHAQTPLESHFEGLARDSCEAQPDAVIGHRPPLHQLGRGVAQPLASAEIDADRQHARATAAEVDTRQAHRQGHALRRARRRVGDTGTDRQLDRVGDTQHAAVRAGQLQRDDRRCIGARRPRTNLRLDQPRREAALIVAPDRLVVQPEAEDGG